MKRMNPHFVALSRWWTGLTKETILGVRWVFSIVMSFLLVHGLKHGLGKVGNAYVSEALALLLTLFIFLKITRYGTMSMKGYFDYEKLYEEKEKLRQELQMVHEELQASHEELQKAHAETQNALVGLQTAHEELQATSIIDQLTGAYNANYYPMAGEKVTELAIRGNCSIVYGIIDVDLMKEINDTYGHPVGSVALRAVGQMLIRFFRGSDYVVRYGGDEFVVLGYTDNPLAMIEKMKKIKQVEIMYLDANEASQTLIIPVTYGCSYLASVEQKPDEMSAAEYADIIIEGLFKEADLALYAAKSKKKLKR